MIFERTSVDGAFLVRPELRGDERGFFGRLFCRKAFAERGLATDLAQINDSFSAQSGTLRGMHFQRAPHAETKLVRCVRGALYDVVLDIRPESPTFGRSSGHELTADNRHMLYVPKGCAHGFMTLTDDVEMLYFVDEFYAPGAEGGVRWDDPRFNIEWPMAPTVISDKDRAWPDFVEPDRESGR